MEYWCFLCNEMTQATPASLSCSKCGSEFIEQITEKTSQVPYEKDHYEPRGKRSKVTLPDISELELDPDPDDESPSSGAHHNLKNQNFNFPHQPSRSNSTQTSFAISELPRNSSPIPSSSSSAAASRPLKIPGARSVSEELLEPIVEHPPSDDEWSMERRTMRHLGFDPDIFIGLGTLQKRRLREVLACIEWKWVTLKSAGCTLEALPPIDKDTLYDHLSLNKISEVQVKWKLGCSICLVEFTLGQEVASMNKCGHVFHKECIWYWLEVSESCSECLWDNMSDQSTEQNAQRDRNESILANGDITSHPKSFSSSVSGPGSGSASASPCSSNPNANPSRNAQEDGSEGEEPLGAACLGYYDKEM